MRIPRGALFVPIALVAVALLGAVPNPPAGGSVSGRVLLVENGKTVSSEHGIFVYLQPAKRTRKKKGAPPPPPREIRQEKLQFSPHVLVVPVGTTVAFPNYDRDTHNVYSPTDPRFDLGRYSTDHKGKTNTFLDPDEFDIYCDIHREMWAKVKVVDTPYIAEAHDGKFSFDHIPAGTYKVVAWTVDAAETPAPEQVTVKDGGAVEVKGEIHLQLVKKSACHDRYDGSQYPSQYATCPTH